MFVNGLCAPLAADPALEVDGAASAAAAALAWVRQTRPDVELMDLKLPDGDGVQPTRQILAELPGTAILIMNMFDDVGGRCAPRGRPRLSAQDQR